MEDAGNADRRQAAWGGIQPIPAGRTARLVERNGGLVAEADTVVTDDDVLGLIDAGRCGVVQVGDAITRGRLGTDGGLELLGRNQQPSRRDRH